MIFFVFVCVCVFRQFDGDMLYVFRYLILSPSFWLLTIVVVPMCLLPDILVNIYNTYRPTKLHSMEEKYSSQDAYSVTYSQTSITSESQVSSYVTYEVVSYLYLFNVIYLSTLSTIKSH